MKSIGIISCGLGNIKSIINMLRKIGFEASEITNVNDLLSVEKLILPGVGHYDYGVSCLQKSGLKNALVSMVNNEKVPILGICLGMQLLCQDSEEGKLAGLGLVDAHVRRIFADETSKLKVPHMGWNKITLIKNNKLIDITKEQRFYFVHSFKVELEDKSLLVAECKYGEAFCCAFQKDNIFGVQFHPEKSHSFGMDLLLNFAQL